MSPYASRFADLYDLFYEDKDYEAEARFVHDRIQEMSPDPPKSVIDVACGTGGHSMVLHRLGYSVTGIDSSADMIRVAQNKAKRLEADISFLIQDMRSLRLPDESFDAAVCLFASIGYAQTNEGILASLLGINRCLRPDGFLVMEFWHAAAMLRSYEPVRVKRWRSPGGQVIRISETRLMPREQLAEVNYTILEADDDAEGGWRPHVETHRNRYFLVQEMAGWLERCSFRPLFWYAGFDIETEIDEDTWHIVVVARRA